MLKSQGFRVLLGPRWQKEQQKSQPKWQPGRPVPHSVCEWLGTRRKLLAKLCFLARQGPADQDKHLNRVLHFIL